MRSGVCRTPPVTPVTLPATATVPAVPASAHRFDAIFLDVGGVLVMPHLDTVIEHFAAAGLPVERDRLLEAHYRGVLAIDLAQAAPEFFGDYHREFVQLPASSKRTWRRGVAVLEAVWETAALWREPLPWTADGLAALTALGVPLVVVSNADGPSNDCWPMRASARSAPAGEPRWPGIVDSGVVGVAKPDPAIFRLALDLVGVPADRAVHIGDTYQYDVIGARAAGVHPVLMDPLDLRPDVDCDRTLLFPIGVKNSRPVLPAPIRTLPVPLRRIVRHRARIPSAVGRS